MFKIPTRLTLVSLFVAVTLMLVPVLGMAAAQEDVIAAAADVYLNNPDTVFNISSEGLMEQMLGDNLPLVISLRPAESFALGHVIGAVNMPFGTLFESENLSALPDDNKIIVTCYTGHTASQATALLNLCGYDATNLKWGIMGWTKDTTVATKQFANPDSDLPVETAVNEATETFMRHSVDVTSSTDEAEIIRAACNAYASAGEKNIKAGDLLNLLMDGDDSNDPVIVSVRTAEQYAKGHIPGAINIPFKEIARIENLERLNPDRQIVVYEKQRLNAPSREGGDEKCLLPKAALFVVKWRHGYKERQSLCVRHEISPGMGTEVSEVDTAGGNQRSGKGIV